MTWTKKKLKQIPQIYRDGLLALEPVISSRESPLRINGIHGGRLLTVLNAQYGYSRDGMQTTFENLEAQGLINIDKELGFVAPTKAGEELILALQREQEKISEEVPPFPAFQE